MDEWGGKPTQFLNKSLINIDKSLKDLYITYWLEFRPIIYGLDLRFFYSDTLMRDDIA